jgi:hypothetical protein
MLQLLYDIHTCDHATYLHFHHPLWDRFAIMIPIDITNKTIKIQLYCDYYATTCNLIKIQIICNILYIIFISII